jgi:hypothetical protein
MVPAETIPGKMLGSGQMIYLIYCKNICKCHNVSPRSTTIKEVKKKKTQYLFGFFHN